MTTPDGRDQQIVDLLLANRSFPEIATALALSQETVENRIKRLRRRHFVHTTTQLVVKLLTERVDERDALLAQRTADLATCRAQLAVLDRRQAR